MGGLLSGDSQSGRVAMLRAFAEQRPHDPFPRYALAIELKSKGQAQEALEVLQKLIAQQPDYIASYAPAGEILVELGRVPEARAVYGQGIEACVRGNDAHTRGNLEEALAALDG